MTAGALVPDSIVINMIAKVLEKRKRENILFDGFPRTLVQAQSLDKNLLQFQMQVDLVLNLQVPLEEIIQRISSRWTHLPSGRVYSYGFKPPKVEGRDDITDEPLVQRDDDKPEAVRKRL
uniref:Adenylate kinase isoenzyme 4, mitochondrial n=1 Tax=Lygus hesperus TaxID=30085 RepID=A0A0A9W9P0_LYGHE